MEGGKSHLPYAIYHLRWVLSKMPSSFRLYYITDRTQLKSTTLEDAIAKAIDAGVDWVQIREKDLPARRMLGVAEAAVERARQHSLTKGERVLKPSQAKRSENDPVATTCWGRGSCRRPCQYKRRSHWVREV